MSRHRSKSDPVAQRVRRQRSESLDVDKDRASNTPRFYWRAAAYSTYSQGQIGVVVVINFGRHSKGLSVVKFEKNYSK